ncbi:MAG TPA: amino acid ABC transporter ATP-binding protein [Actinomycetes bacterium]
MSATARGGDLLRLDGVHKAFGPNAVLRGIDLSVRRHEVVTLIGASGSGKSTLLKCVNALEPVDAGRIVLLGDGADGSVGDIEVSSPETALDAVRARVGIVFQSFNLFPHMTVLDNVALAPRKVRGRDRAESETAGRALLERFGLADKAADYPDRLSGGQQQRVAIVRALAMEPELMLFDEVTSALDPELVGEVLDVIRGLKAAGMTIVMATHEMAFAREISDRICFLDAGVVCEIGPPDQLFGAPVEERTRQFLERVSDWRT